MRKKKETVAVDHPGCEITKQRHILGKTGICNYPATVTLKTNKKKKSKEIRIKISICCTVSLEFSDKLVFNF